MKLNPPTQITLRDVIYDDLTLLKNHRNQNETQQWLEKRVILSDKDQIKWFSTGNANHFKILESDGNRIGLARISPSSADFYTTIGLDIFSEFRGKGYANIAFKTIMSFALNSTNRLDLWVFEDNSKAVSLYKNNGFVYDESTPLKIFWRKLPTGEYKICNYFRMIYLS